MRARWLRWAAALGALAVGALFAASALARPGGGQTFSAPGGGGSGGGDGGEIAGLVIYLVLHHPTVGVPLLVVVAGVVLYVRFQQKRHPSWSVGGHPVASALVGDLIGGPSTPPAPAGRPVPGARSRLEAIARAHDPDFSLVSFEDFAYALFGRAHALRGAGPIDALSAFFTPDALTRFARGSDAVARVEAIVVGDMLIEGASPPSEDHPFLSASVQLEANSTEVGADGRERAYWVRERWRLRRHRDARTKPPEAISVERCPSCGAGLETHARSGACSYCGQRVDTGDFDWVVEQVIPLAKERRGPQLTGTTVERGTHLPTVYAPDMAEKMAALRAKDPAVDPDGLAARVKLIHRKINEAWTNRQWEDARPFLSDALFRMQTAWIETYRREGLTNVLDDVRLEKAEIVRVGTDRWYDAVTLRIFAASKDSTVRDATGEVVAGDPGQDRAYSEYWTLIRRTDARGPTGASERCPSCGAGLDVNAAGVCAYCDTKITSGRFDWVLSKIEQDESYRG